MESRRSTTGRVVVAGSVMLDWLIAPLARIPRWDENIFVEKVLLHVGGLAANTAIGLAHLKVPVDLCACIGNDAHGELIVHHLQRAGVDCRHIRRSTRHPTSLSFGFVDEKGRRFFIVSLGANAHLQKRDIECIDWSGVQFFHLGGFFHLPRLEPALPTLLSALRRRGIRISLDLAWDPHDRWMRSLRFLLPHVDVFFPNEKQTQRLTGMRSVRQGARKLRREGVRTVVVKRGARGCYVDSDEWRGGVPAFPVRVVDTTGAGDVFDAAFLYGWRAGWDFQTCARFANVMAAASTRTYGATTALPARATALRWVKTFYGLPVTGSTTPSEPRNRRK